MVKVVISFVALIFPMVPLLGQSVEIRVNGDYWNAFSAPIKSEVRIRGKDGKFTTDGKKIDSNTMHAFLAALEEPPVDTITMANLGINQQWLDANAEFAFLEYFKEERRRDISLAQRKLFENSFRDAEFMRHVSLNYYQSFWTDDYPKLHVTIKVNGRSVQLDSHEQHQFMIPWTINDSRGTRKTFNADISRTLAALLPRKAMHRSRLEGARLRYELSEHLISALDDKWGKLTTEAKIPREIAEIRKSYSLEKSDVNCIMSIDVNGDCPSWNALLRSPNLPTNLAIGVSLPYENGRLPNLPLFNQKIPSYVGLTISVPWFSEYLANHPGVEAQIRFVVDRSLSEHATHELLEDLRKHDRGQLAQRVEKESRDSVFVEVSDENHDWSRWIIFPNKDMLLWHFRSNNVLGLGLPAVNFSAWEYYGWKSAGVLVRPDGIVAP